MGMRPDLCLILALERSSGSLDTNTKLFLQVTGCIGAITAADKSVLSDAHLNVGLNKVFRYVSARRQLDKEPLALQTQFYSQS
jgi:hypothetical protein